MSRFQNPVPFIQDDDGKPIVGAKLFFFEPGTTTPKTIYSDPGLETPTDNPQISKAGGRYTDDIFLDGVYAVEQQDNSGTPTGYDGVLIWEKDPVGDITTGQLEPWVNDETYNVGDIVLGSDVEYYRSIINGNQGNDPTTSPEEWEQIQYGRVWNEFITYNLTDSVYGSDGLLYITKVDGNLGNNPVSDSVNWRLFNDEPDLLNNVSFTSTVDTKALTFDLKTNGGEDPSTNNKVLTSFRGSLTTADYTIESAVAATDIVAPDGATLGFDDAATGFIYLYLLNNAGTLELAISASIFDETILHTTVAIDATADSGAVLYSTTARIDVPIRMVGRIQIQTGAVAGEWDNAPTELFAGGATATFVTTIDPIPTTSGTAIDITGLPSGITNLILFPKNVSVDGSNKLLLQLGGSGGIETTGYESTAMESNSGGNTVDSSTSGMKIVATGASENLQTGVISLYLADPATNLWHCTAQTRRTSSTQNFSTSIKPLSEELAQVRLTTDSTPDDFDSGTISGMYW